MRALEAYVEEVLRGRASHGGLEAFLEPSHAGAGDLGHVSSSPRAGRIVVHLLDQQLDGAWLSACAQTVVTARLNEPGDDRAGQLVAHQVAVGEQVGVPKVGRETGNEVAPSATVAVLEVHLIGKEVLHGGSVGPEQTFDLDL